MTSHNKGKVTLKPEAEQLVLSFTVEQLRAAMTRHPKARDVIVLRYGLVDGHKRTNQEIGNIMNFTRERSRNLEKIGLRALEKAKKKS